MSPTGSARPLLTLGWSTLADRLTDLSVPDAVWRDPRLEVLICVQTPDGEVAPPLPERLSGARVIHQPGAGVARSRNAVLQAAAGRYLVFGDDDVEVCLDGVLASVADLESAGAALALARADSPASRGDGPAHKRYPATPFARLTRMNSGRAATYEMVVDVDQVRGAGVSFDVRFGAGADLYLGDEYLFIIDVVRAGLAAWSVPHVVGIHPDVSSGTRWGGRDLEVRAIVLNEAFGALAPAARLAFGLRHRRDLGGWEGLRRFVRVARRAAPRREVS